MMMSGSVKPQHRESAKLSTGEKISYGVGDVANAFSWNFIASYLMFFYTDVFGISAWTVSTLFLIGRLWDAISDPLIGFLSDETRTRWGRYRPWILFAALPLALCTILTFWAHPEMSEGAKTVYVFVTYGVTVFAYTCINIPYTALATAMTQDSRECGSLASYRMALALAGAVISAQFGARLVPLLSEAAGGDAASGYLWTAVILMALALPLYMFCFRGTKEVVVLSEPLPKDYLRQALRSSLHNVPLLLAIAAHFIVGLTIYGRMAVVTYYFTYLAGDPAAAGTFFIFMQVSMMLGSFASQFVAERARGKGQVITWSFCLYGVLSILNMFLTPMEHGAAFWALVSIASFVQGIGYSQTYAIIPDTVEYNEYQAGIRNEGVAASLTTFWNKVGMAIGTSATAAVLAALNYVPGAVQSAQTLSTINIIMFLVPGVAGIAVGLLFFAYKLDYGKFDSIMAELSARKHEANTEKG